MKRYFSGALSLALLSYLTFQGNVVQAADASVPLDTSEVTITNNVGKADSIYVTGVTGGDTVTIYNAATKGKVLAKRTVTGQNTAITIPVSQLGSSAGSVYITVTSKGMTESSRTEIDYDAEGKSDAPLADNITITNNSGKVDTIYVSGLAPKDKVKVYTAATGGKLLCSSTIGGNKTDTTMSISQLGTSDGSIYVSVMSDGMLESDRTKVDFSGELQSDAPLASNVTITNNSGKPDTIYLSGLAPSDKVKVYTAATGGKLLCSGTVGSSKTELTLNMSQLGSNGGNVYVTVTSPGLSESGRTKVAFSAEGQSGSISSSDITITNNSGKSDTIYVTGLTLGDKVNVYNAATGGRLLGSATAGANGSSTVSVGQLGVSAGTVYISVTSSGMLESSRLAVSYSAESQSSSIDSSCITVTNNAGKADTVYVSGLLEGETVKVYDAASGGNLLGSSTVASGATDATVTISQLGISAGAVYVSVTSTNKLESDRIKADYSAEQKTSAISTNNVAITNNPAGTPDTVYVSDLTAGDLVKVYNSASGGTLLASATVEDSAADTTISIAQLGTDAGSVYISVTSKGNSESDRVKVDYGAESKSDTLDASNIVVTNNVGTSDTVVVSGLSSSEVVNVYDAAKGGNLLGTATVATGSTQVTVTISQLGTNAGSVYVSLKDTNKRESDRTQVNYEAEGKTSTLNEDNIVVTNNSGKSDTVYVSGLTAADVVNAYDSATGGTLLGSATVGDSDTNATISIAQLGTSSGSVYVSITSKNKSESDRVKADYAAEAKSNTLNANNIVVTNNVGSNDTVQVSGVYSGQVINVYDAEKGGNLLGTATVPSGSTFATVSISQLGSSTGSVYVSLTDTNKLEGDRVQANYAAESTSDSLSAGNISITNRSGSADTVNITGASQNDVINVYDLAKGGTLLGTATVAAGDTKASISITQLGTDAGSVYVSRKSLNKAESDRVKVDYDAEPKSTAPSASNIVATNNAGINDTVEVKGLSVGDLVQIYDSANGGTLLGSATVESNDTEATVSIAQLGTNSGNIYVSITSTNKSESDRTQVAFSAETQSNEPSASKIDIVNNAREASTVKVAGLTNGDIVKVYDSATGGTLLGSGTVGTYDTSVTVFVTQLGENAGNVYVTVTSTGKLESNRAQVAFAAKTVSTAPSSASITVTNNASKSDTVEVTGLQPNDVIKVYDASTGGNLLGTVTVASDDMEGIVNISQLGASAGTVYVSVTSTGKIESGRTAVDYSAESQSDPLEVSDVTIANNAGTADTIDVTGLSEGDIVKVYSIATGGTAIGTATVSSGESEAIVTVSQLGTNAGTVYVSVTRSGKTESSRTVVNYSAESTAPIVGNISIVNNAVISDTITVKGLASNDLVKVYDASTGGNLIGSAIVAANGDEATVTVSQLTTGTGSVYVSVTNFGKGESKRTKADYIAEQTSAALYAGNVNIVNNSSGTPDVITVSNLSGSDVIKVYDASTGGNLIGTATVSSSGTQATITISQLSTAAGSVYISVTNLGKNESSRVKIDYTAEN
ncbi:hypothetical protein JMF89_02460 [Clostridiaceae bacterium UIB06]|uniref:Uncharacterized protein n=1 Tax=Clostridium thailandense TaxID=2794346 RepID=A0A949WQU8_9CLOT|nr:hypothetical protein [Clostridium thailandense]MBV7273215.1 hypothetical protein [Clostridium thailandense]MCH5136072.1 hypothetical protein [Clostridiaceae bacterium UIB06]